MNEVGLGLGERDNVTTRALEELWVFMIVIGKLLLRTTIAVKICLSSRIVKQTVNRD